MSQVVGIVMFICLIIILFVSLFFWISHLTKGPKQEKRIVLLPVNGPSPAYRREHFFAPATAPAPNPISFALNAKKHEIEINNALEAGDIELAEKIHSKIDLDVDNANSAAILLQNQAEPKISQAFVELSKIEDAFETLAKEYKSAEVMVKQDDVVNLTKDKKPTGLLKRAPTKKTTASKGKPGAMSGPQGITKGLVGTAKPSFSQPKGKPHPGLMNQINIRGKPNASHRASFPQNAAMKNTKMF